ncbi:MAG: DEAD/DEAH box helicase [Planctomycetota bacterium]|nr:DEAD/DEAH box helicase [Planctomycetota bacterium]
MTVARFVIDLLTDQRFIPTMYQSKGEDFRASWQPWLHDDAARAKVGALIMSMPPSVRAIFDKADHEPWAILDEALRTMTNIAVRRVLQSEQYIEAIEDRDPTNDAHVSWLSGLLDRNDTVPQSDGAGSLLLRDVRGWVGRLDDRGQDLPFHLSLQLEEPAESVTLEELKPIDSRIKWIVSMHLQSPDDPDLRIEAANLWDLRAGGLLPGGIGAEKAQEVLLTELGRASRIYDKIENALNETTPNHLELSTAEAYEFLTDYKPLLEESGFEVIVPDWWKDPSAQIGARLFIDAPELNMQPRTAEEAADASNMVGLQSLVNYQWQIAIGDQPLSMDEFHALAAQNTPLVRLRGRWVEIRPDQIEKALKFIESQPDGEMPLLQAIRLAHGAAGKNIGLHVSGFDATGWVNDLLGASQDEKRMPQLDQPKGFLGELRPYQQSGLSWLAFLDRFGLGACLADDMGLGKTIQMIALLLYERESAFDPDAIGPTLLVVPTSLVGNWQREIERFAPSLRVHINHGPDRPLDDLFHEAVRTNDVVITTYGLVSRDRETLSHINWHRVALDEAQYIKNPPTKQTRTIRALKTTRRIALTGTPVENRLAELWSIMEFLNPGYLGTVHEFRQQFAVPIERHRDPIQAERLRGLIQPFVLRRLKTDRNVIDDLPDCLETKEYATLTSEQATMYERSVKEMLGSIEQAEGIHRRGAVLATLVKLKQICNHPILGVPAKGGKKVNAETLAEDISEMGELSARSGKCRRLKVMLDEVLASDGKALIFTQFRRMGHLLTTMIQRELGCEAMFLHGGTPIIKRQQMIDRFNEPEPGHEVPIFVLSLKAGGIGLNLTAANHVFHFDRWWNPAVENQATDRAFRIGQTRTVHVHKFVCTGTLEERIDQMIEQKTKLAENIIGAGEQWLTELGTQQLRDILTLRTSAVEGDA